MHSSPEETLTIVRDPLERIASGLVHNFHDCGRMKRPQKLCNQLDAEMSTFVSLAEQNRVSELVASPTWKVIHEYAKCVSGCSTNMLAGLPCSSKPPQAFTPQLATKLESLAFVGLTNEWNKTLCSFYHLFPRPDGNPYVHDTRNTRPTQDDQCKQNVLWVLRHSPEHLLYYNETMPDPDFLLYEKGMSLFNERLPKECQ